MKGVRTLLKTTAIRLSLIYTLIFGLLAVAIILYMTSSTVKILRQQFETSIDTEIRELSGIYQEGGINRLVGTMERRALAPGANLYILTDSTGRIIAGNVLNIQSGVLDQTGWTGRPFGYTRFADKTSHNYLAVARVFEIPNGMRVLIGRDIGERETFRKVVRRALFFSLGAMLLLGVLTWLLVGRRALKRIDLVSQSTNRILSGDRKERLPVTGAGDEFDRLAGGMNDMLDRIDQLDEGLKQVSDNIAHDLKTPLTRLRTKVEAGMQNGKTADDYRDTLAVVVDECDALIKTFNALLMISRVDSGSTTAKFTMLNLSEVIEDIAELYRPMVEDEGIEFTTSITPGIKTMGNRELLSQAMANLIDNAIKYSRNDDGEITSIWLKLHKVKVGGEIIVADNGPGIPSDNREFVMERFTRLEKSRTESGSGLGLSLVKAVVKLHKGKITLSDNEPGLVVSIVLPLAQDRL